MNTRKLLVSVLMLVSILLTACAPAATPAPTAVPPTTEVSTVAPAQDQTEFSSKIFNLHMTVNFGSNWHVIDDYSDLVTVVGKENDWNVAFNIVTHARVADPVSGAQVPFPDDFAAWIKSNSDFKAGEPIETTIAGIKGLQIDAVPMPSKQKDFLYMSRTKWNIIPSTEQWRFILLNDVNGERLLILLIAPASQFTDAVAQSQPILDSVIFSTTATTQTLTKFASSTFNLPMTLSYASDWNIEQYPNQVYLQKLRTDSWELAFNFVEGATIADPNSAGEIPWPQDLVAYLKSNPHIETGDPKPVTVGGFKGIQIDAHAKYTGDKRPFITIAGSSEGWLYLDYEEMWRFIVLDDVNGKRLVITMTASPTSPTTPVTEFSKFTDEAQKVLDTVVFSKP